GSDPGDNTGKVPTDNQQPSAVRSENRLTSRARQAILTSNRRPLWECRRNLKGQATWGISADETLGTLLQKTEFTQEVNCANAALTTSQQHFQEALNEIDAMLESNGVRPAQLLAALQDAANCETALEELARAFDAEERKHTKINHTLKSTYQSKLDANRSSFVARASSVISAVSSFGDLADQVKETVVSVSNRSPESVFSDASSSVPGPSSFSSAQSDAQRAKAELTKDSFKSYSNIAWWSAAGAVVISWLSGVSFVAGLGIGGLVALGVFVVYGSKINRSAGAIRRLVNAAETEFANIRKEKFDSDASAQKEYANQSKVEDDRFHLVKKNFDDTVEATDIELASLADRLSKLSQKWQELNEHLFHRRPQSSSEQASENRSTALGTQFAVLGAASLSAIARSERSKGSAASHDSKPKDPHASSDDPKQKDPIEGEIYRGRITKIVDFGAFVNFFGERDGLVHISQIENRRLNHPSDVLKEGQEVWVKFLGFDDRGKVRLSMKAVDQNHVVNGSVSSGVSGRGESSAAPNIRPRIDRHGQAEMLFDMAMAMFQDADAAQDGEKKREALILLSDCVEQFPEFVKAHCVLTRALLSLNDPEKATKTAAKAYEIHPNDSEVCNTYASCFVKKGNVLWDQGDRREALDAFIAALKINGFELQAFAASRNLAKETDQLSRWARECVEIGIDPLKEVDVREVRPQ
ncbi:tetratricopeptide repeat protein, partial [Pararhodobacter sp. SW119]|uniref:S1 RNA-binding domain-containing protein n=1 Tax=Pararhodobacter sp. SW119 TaxID=2780075 RepID=UPI001FD7E8B5